MKKIILNTGQILIIDKEDFKKVIRYKWHFHKLGYVESHNVENKRVYIHRYITNAPKGKIVDHINRNKLDNRKSNLRICTQSENLRNASIRSDNTSGYIGINWLEWLKKWRAYINKNGKQINLGVFSNKKLAIKARKRAEKIYA